MQTAAAKKAKLKWRLEKGKEYYIKNKDRINQLKRKRYSDNELIRIKNSVSCYNYRIKNSAKIKEKSKLDNSVNENKSKADSALSSQYNWDQANQMMKSLVPGYQWKDSKPDPYSSYNPDMLNPNVNGKYVPGAGTVKGDYSKPSFGEYDDVLSKLKSAATNSFSGPKNFSYSLGQNAQNYNSNLKDDNAFGNYLQNTYRERSSTPLTSGQLSLQKQLDTTNDNLAQARENLLKQYSGLEGYKNNAVADTNNYLQNKESTYRANQNLLRDNFQNEQEAYNSENQKQIEDAMKVYGETEKGYRDSPPKYLTPAQVEQSKDTIFQARKYKLCLFYILDLQNVLLLYLVIS